ncbi:unnamed protein product [Camellia sinensis]
MVRSYVEKMDELVHENELYKTSWHFLHLLKNLYFLIDVLVEHIWVE